WAGSPLAHTLRHIAVVALDESPDCRLEAWHGLAEPGEQVIQRYRRSLQRGGLSLEQLDHVGRAQVEEVEKEVVGALRLYPIRHRMEVLQVARHDHLCPGLHGDRGDMTVLLVVEIGRASCRESVLK